MAVTTDSTAPYAPPSGILDIIQKYRHRGLRTPFTRDVLALAGITDSLQPRTLQALQILDLIDEEGGPTATLEALRVAPESEFKDRLADWVRQCYAEVFQFVDPATEPSNVRDAFRLYEPRGQQARMVTLFVGLCEAAGIVDSAPKQKQARPRAQSSRTVRRPRQNGTDSKSTPKIHSGLADGVPAALAGMIASLPTSHKWTQDERDRWLAAFKGALDFAIRVVEPDDEHGNGAQS